MSNKVYSLLPPSVRSCSLFDEIAGYSCFRAFHFVRSWRIVGSNAVTYYWENSFAQRLPARYKLVRCYE